MFADLNEMLNMQIFFVDPDLIGFFVVNYVVIFVVGVSGQRVSSSHT